METRRRLSPAGSTRPKPQPLAPGLLGVPDAAANFSRAEGGSQTSAGAERIWTRPSRPWLG